MTLTTTMVKKTRPLRVAQPFFLSPILFHQLNDNCLFWWEETKYRGGGLVRTEWIIYWKECSVVMCLGRFDPPSGWKEILRGTGLWSPQPGKTYWHNLKTKRESFKMRTNQIYIYTSPLFIYLFLSFSICLSLPFSLALSHLVWNSFTTLQYSTALNGLYLCTIFLFRSLSLHPFPL
jgi:hypothetical protein